MNMDLTVGKPEKVLWRFCIPLFGSILFQQLYNIADSLVAGRFIGENALAAVGNSYEITLIFIAFAFGCNIGCSVVVSMFFGAKQYGKVKTADSIYRKCRFVRLPDVRRDSGKRRAFAADQNASEGIRRFEAVSGYLYCRPSLCVFL